MSQPFKLSLKLAGWAFLIHVILIALTFAEVFVYSMTINTGQPVAVYEQHAQQSGPIVGIVIGFVLVWWVARLLIAKNREGIRQISWGLPVAYIVIDIIMVVMSGTSLLSTPWIFSLSYLSKLLAGYLAARGR